MNPCSLCNEQPVSRTKVEGTRRTTIIQCQCGNKTEPCPDFETALIQWNEANQ